jgi:hypothetical protein
MRKRYKLLIDTPKDKEEISEFDTLYEQYKEMFKIDPIFIGIISRRLFGNDKKKRFRFGDYMLDKTFMEAYEESKLKKPIEYLK